MGFMFQLGVSQCTHMAAITNMCPGTAGDGQQVAVLMAGVSSHNSYLIVICQ